MEEYPVEAVLLLVRTGILAAAALGLVCWGARTLTGRSTSPPRRPAGAAVVGIGIAVKWSCPRRRWPAPRAVRSQTGEASAELLMVGSDRRVAGDSDFGLVIFAHGSGHKPRQAYPCRYASPVKPRHTETITGTGTEQKYSGACRCTISDRIS